MVQYTVTLVTSHPPQSGTFSTPLLTLIGTKGTSKEFKLDTPLQNLRPGSATLCSSSLSPLLWGGWFWSGYTQRAGLASRAGLALQGGAGGAPGGRRSTSPAGSGSVAWAVWSCGREQLTVCGETLELLKQHRNLELQSKQETYRWRTLSEGLPHCVDMTSLEQLGPDFRYTRSGPAFNAHYLRGFAERRESWKSFEEIETLFIFNCPPDGAATAEYVRSHWQLDSFFGYQFLNGCNPYVIRQCKTPPPNLAVTPEMVQPSLPACTSLPQEMEVRLSVSGCLSVTLCVCVSVCDSVHVSVCLLNFT
ncbi:hydroperoxide isomerase ALOXE3-like [Acipenser oxyrinchus oxyrinchus]|uniref:Hydroperoxide isomerase ALOXE3-like n=1 Tax=Acipenser oxyrinchus oxyrinchus TaxID=40147 RepID=A0AAD8CDG8_ACIOX|nr:hydroperoxide isomerase ALOXE3-like [Acipenser oxyrinchus oxyrinchus]